MEAHLSGRSLPTAGSAPVQSSQARTEVPFVGHMLCMWLPFVCTPSGNPSSFFQGAHWRRHLFSGHRDCCDDERHPRSRAEGDCSTELAEELPDRAADWKLKCWRSHVPSLNGFLTKSSRPALVLLPRAPGAPQTLSTKRTSLRSRSVCGKMCGACLDCLVRRKRPPFSRPGRKHSEVKQLPVSFSFRVPSFAKLRSLLLA